MKFSPPTKGIGMRKVLRKRGYDVFLVNEYNTSKINFFTKTENEKFRRRQNPRPWKKDIRKCHGLLRTKCVPDSELSNSNILVNRDTNAAVNIRYLACCAINNEPRPSEYCRSSTNQ